MSEKTPVYAGFWIRTVALFIDSAILFLPMSLIENLARGQMLGTTSPEAMMADPEAMKTSFLISLAVQLTFGFFYFGILQGKLQGTPGKLILGLRVVTTNLERITIARSIGRYFSQFLSMFGLFLGYLWVAFGARKQGWHDKLAGTYVVKKKSLLQTQPLPEGNAHNAAA